MEGRSERPGKTMSKVRKGLRRIVLANRLLHQTRKRVATAAVRVARRRSNASARLSVHHAQSIAQLRYEAMGTPTTGSTTRGAELSAASSEQRTLHPPAISAGAVLRLCGLLAMQQRGALVWRSRADGGGIQRRRHSFVAAIPNAIESLRKDSQTLVREILPFVLVGHVCKAGSTASSPDAEAVESPREAAWRNIEATGLAPLPRTRSMSPSPAERGHVTGRSSARAGSVRPETGSSCLPSVHASASAVSHTDYASSVQSMHLSAVGSSGTSESGLESVPVGEGIDRPSSTHPDPLSNRSSGPPHPTHMAVRSSRGQYRASGSVSATPKRSGLKPAVDGTTAGPVLESQSHNRAHGRVLSGLTGLAGARSRSQSAQPALSASSPHRPLSESPPPHAVVAAAAATGIADATTAATTGTDEVGTETELIATHPIHRKAKGHRELMAAFRAVAAIEGFRMERRLEAQGQAQGQAPSTTHGPFRQPGVTGAGTAGGWLSPTEWESSSDREPPTHGAVRAGAGGTESVQDGSFDLTSPTGAARGLVTAGRVTRASNGGLGGNASGDIGFNPSASRRLIDLEQAAHSATAQSGDHVGRVGISSVTPDGGSGTAEGFTDGMSGGVLRDGTGLHSADAAAVTVMSGVVQSQIGGSQASAAGSDRSRSRDHEQQQYQILPRRARDIRDSKASATDTGTMAFATATDIGTMATPTTAASAAAAGGGNVGLIGRAGSPSPTTGHVGILRKASPQTAGVQRANKARGGWSESTQHGGTSKSLLKLQATVRNLQVESLAAIASGGAADNSKGMIGRGGKGIGQTAPRRAPTAWNLWGWRKTAAERRAEQVQAMKRVPTALFLEDVVGTSRGATQKLAGAKVYAPQDSDDEDEEVVELLTGDGTRRRSHAGSVARRSSHAQSVSRRRGRIIGDGDGNVDGGLSSDDCKTRHADEGGPDHHQDNDVQEVDDHDDDDHDDDNSAAFGVDAFDEVADEAEHDEEEVDTRKIFEPTGLEEFADVVSLARQHDATRPTLAAVACPCYMCIRRPQKLYIEGILGAWWYVALTVLATSMSLIVGDLVRGLTDAPADVWVEVASVLALLVLLVDVMLSSFVNRRYIYSPDWWLDVLAALSIAADLPIVLRSIGLTDMAQLAAGEAGGVVTALFRDARRVFRMLKLFRLIPIDRFHFRLPLGLDIIWARITGATRKHIRFLKRLYIAKLALQQQLRFKSQEVQSHLGMTEVSAKLASRIQLKVSIAALLLIVAVPALSRNTSSVLTSTSPYATDLAGPTAPALSTALEATTRGLAVAAALSSNASAFIAALAAGAGTATSSSHLCNTPSLSCVSPAITTAGGGHILALTLGSYTVISVGPTEYETRLRGSEIGRVTVDLCKQIDVDDGSGVEEAGISASNAEDVPGSSVSPALGPGSTVCSATSLVPTSASVMIDVSATVRAASLWDLLTTNVLMLVLCLQAALVQNDVEKLLLRPLQRLASVLRPFYDDGIRLLQKRRWGTVGDVSVDDGEALSTRLLLASTLALRARLDQAASAQYTSKKIRGMLQAKARVHGGVEAAVAAYRPLMSAMGDYRRAAAAAQSRHKHKYGGGANDSSPNSGGANGGGADTGGAAAGGGGGGGGVIGRRVSNATGGDALTSMLHDGLAGSSGHLFIPGVTVPMPSTPDSGVDPSTARALSSNEYYRLHGNHQHVSGPQSARGHRVAEHFRRDDPMLADTSWTALTSPSTNKGDTRGGRSGVAGGVAPGSARSFASHNSRYSPHSSEQSSHKPSAQSHRFFPEESSRLGAASGHTTPLRHQALSRVTGADLGLVSTPGSVGLEQASVQSLASSGQRTPSTVDTLSARAPVGGAGRVDKEVGHTQTGGTPEMPAGGHAATSAFRLNLGSLSDVTEARGRSPMPGLDVTEASSHTAHRGATVSTGLGVSIASNSEENEGDGRSAPQVPSSASEEATTLDLTG